jgi:hypothetical protein
MHIKVNSRVALVSALALLVVAMFAAAATAQSAKKVPS